MVSIPESAATPARERSCLPEVIFEGMSQGRVKLLGGLPQEGWVQGSVHLQGKWPLERHTRSGASAGSEESGDQACRRTRPDHQCRLGGNSGEAEKGDRPHQGGMDFDGEGLGGVVRKPVNAAVGAPPKRRPTPPAASPSRQEEPRPRRTKAAARATSQSAL